MLRLWPKEVQAGLFPDHCWLRVGTSGEVREYVPGATDGAGLLAQLALMLDDVPDGAAKGAKVVLTVSDALAAVLCIQRQPHLHGPEELRRYAEICFEKQGRDVDGAWLLHTEFRSFQGNGMAYALPAAWVTEAEKIVTAKGMRLARVMPASAAMYCLPRSRGKAGSIGVLLEAGRISVLAYTRAGLSSFNVEPVTAAPEHALRRMLRRVSADGIPVKALALWTSSANVAPSLLACLESELPDAQIDTLPRTALHAA